MELPPEAKVLLYEYYIYKIKHKEIEKQMKTIKKRRKRKKIRRRMMVKLRRRKAHLT